jgi:hypothetical protein
MGASRQQQQGAPVPNRDQHNGKPYHNDGNEEMTEHDYNYPTTTTDASTSTRHRRRTTQHPATTRMTVGGVRRGRDDKNHHRDRTMTMTKWGGAQHQPRMEGPIANGAPGETTPPSTATSCCLQGGRVMLQLWETAETGWTTTRRRNGMGMVYDQTWGNRNPLTHLA